MKNMTVRQLPDDVHAGLKRRASEHGRSAEAEARAIITEAVRASASEGLGSELHRRLAGLEDLDLNNVRDPAPAKPVEIL